MMMGRKTDYLRFNSLPMNQMLCIDKQLGLFKGVLCLNNICKRTYKRDYKIYFLFDFGIVHIFRVYCKKANPFLECPNTGLQPFCRLLPDKELKSRGIVVGNCHLNVIKTIDYVARYYRATPCDM